MKIALETLTNILPAIRHPAEFEEAQCSSTLEYIYYGNWTAVTSH